MRELHHIAAEIRKSLIPVLLLGETGSGKEVLAEHIHARSIRGRRPFIRINCAGLSESVVESELFGHERGAFTGALQSHRGIFELAHGGSLMLDEVAELPLRTQAKLLRVLESGEFTRLGGSESRRADVRIISATHRGLPELMASGQFRSDLYYRLAGAELIIPPLRERRQEIVALATHFLERSTTALGHGPARLDATAEAALLAHDWPGNVRELRNVIEYAAARCFDGIVRGELLDIRRPHLVRAATRCSGTDLDAPWPTPSARLREQLEAFERQCIRAALARCRDNQTRAARELGISRRALTKKLTKHGFERPRSTGMSLRPERAQPGYANERERS
jgi:DNA-binding NtrC family response regulator